MTELLLLFVGAAYLNNLALIAWFDRAVDAPPFRVSGLSAVAGLLLVSAVLLVFFARDGWQLPPPAMNFLLALTFITTVLGIERCIASEMPRVPARLRSLRNHLPLLVANLAVLASAFLDPPRAHGAIELTVFCTAASAAYWLTQTFHSAMQPRIEGADLPRTLRGAPIAVLTAALMALASMGATGALPW